MKAQTLRFQDEVVLARVTATVAVPSQGYPLAPDTPATHVVKTVAGLGAITGYVLTDKDGTLFVEQSIDGSNFDLVTTIQIIGGISNPFDIPVYGVTVRVRYLNLGVAQTFFRCNIVARPMGGGPPGGGDLGAVGNVNAGIVIASTNTALGVNATFTGQIFQVQPVALGSRFTAFDICRGFAQADQAGTIAVVQGFSQGEMVPPYTNATQTTFAVAAGGNGTQFTQIIVAPFLLVELRNGAAAQTRNRFYASVIA